MSLHILHGWAASASRPGAGVRGWDGCPQPDSDRGGWAALDETQPHSSTVRLKSRRLGKATSAPRSSPGTRLHRDPGGDVQAAGGVWTSSSHTCPR